MSGRGHPISSLMVALAALHSTALAAEVGVRGAWREEGLESLRSLTLDDINASGPLTEEELAAAVPVVPPVRAPNASTLGNHSDPALSSALRCSQPSPVVSWADWPQKAIGKVFYKRGEHSYTCSGAFVGGFRTVLTAGHCCHGKEGWAQDWEVWLNFRYEGGERVGERYRAQRASVNNAWFHERNHAYDWCFLKMHDAGPSYLGYWANFKPGSLSEFWSYGYPRNYGQAHALQADPGYIGELEKQGEGAGVLEGRCIFMRSGCSGGPWYTREGGYVIGLNSFHHHGEATGEYSPYIGDAWLRDCRHAGGCGGGRRLQGSDSDAGLGGGSAPLLV